MNQENTNALIGAKDNFISYLAKHKKKESKNFEKYSSMTLEELIDDLEKDIHKFKISPSMYIGYIVDDLGMDYEEHYEQLNAYMNLFSDVIDIIYK